MPSIRALRASFSYSDLVPLLVDLDFHLGPGWTGLVGENGAGKSTLLSLLTGALHPSAGQILLEPEHARVALCPQRVDEPDADVAELAASDDGDSHRLRGRLGLRPEHLGRWDTLSPGERKRWQIGAALRREPDALLLDEPTQHLDAPARDFILAALRGFDGVGLVVSHDRDLLDALTDRTLRLENGRMGAWPGSYSRAKEAWEHEAMAVRGARAQAKSELRKKEAHLAEARERQRAASRRKSAGKRMRNRYDSDARTLAAHGVVDWAERTHGRKVAALHSAIEKARDALPDAPRAAEIGRSVFVDYALAPKPLLTALDGEPLVRGERVLLEEVRLAVHRAEKIALLGPNGAGKSTLVSRLLEASTVPSERIFFLPQELDAAAGVEALRELRALSRGELGRVLSLVAALGTDPDRLLASEAPSPGEARKLLMARGLARHPWWVVLDEPTNHLDMPSVERIEAALAAYPGALLLVTHDEALARACTDVTWRIRNGRLEVG